MLGSPWFRWPPSPSPGRLPAVRPRKAGSRMHTRAHGASPGITLKLTEFYFNGLSLPGLQQGTPATPGAGSELTWAWPARAAGREVGLGLVFQGAQLTGCGGLAGFLSLQVRVPRARASSRAGTGVVPSVVSHRLPSTCWERSPAVLSMVLAESQRAHRADGGCFQNTLLQSRSISEQRQRLLWRLACVLGTVGGGGCKEESRGTGPETRPGL